MSTRITPIGPPLVEIEVAPDGTVSRVGEDRGTATEEAQVELLFRRPEGISDAEWDRMRSRLAGYWEAMVDEAAGER